MWRWRRMEEISWIDRVRKEEVLHRAKEEEMNILRIKRKNLTGWSHLAWEPPYKTGYLNKR